MISVVGAQADEYCAATDVTNEIMRTPDLKQEVLG